MMADNVKKVVWTRQAQESLKEILEYRYADVTDARNIVRKDILAASKQIVFAKQYQRDEINPQYRRIIVRDYKLLYRESEGYVYIMTVICTKAL